MQESRDITHHRNAWKRLQRHWLEWRTDRTIISGGGPFLLVILVPRTKISMVKIGPPGPFSPGPKFQWQFTIWRKAPRLDTVAWLIDIILPTDWDWTLHWSVQLRCVIYIYIYIYIYILHVLALSLSWASRDLSCTHTHTLTQTDTRKDYYMPPPTMAARDASRILGKGCLS